MAIATEGTFPQRKYYIFVIYDDAAASLPMRRDTDSGFAPDLKTKESH